LPNAVGGMIAARPVPADGHAVVGCVTGCVVAMGLGGLLGIGVVLTPKFVPSADGFGVGPATVGVCLLMVDVDSKVVDGCPVVLSAGPADPGRRSRTVPRLPMRRRMILIKTAISITVERFCTGAMLDERGKDCCTGGVVIGLETERVC
jgi:hypothetical protein